MVGLLKFNPKTGKLEDDTGFKRTLEEDAKKADDDQMDVDQSE